MKRLHRKMTPLLAKQLKTQEERIKMWAWIAKQHYIEPFEREEGSIYSLRFNNPYNFYL